MNPRVGALHPLVLAAVDFAVGSVLYWEVSSALGLLMVGAGLSVLCGIAFQLANRSRFGVPRPFERA